MSKWFLSKIIDDEIMWLNANDEWVEKRGDGWGFSSFKARKKKKELGKEIVIYNSDVEMRGGYLQEVIFEDDDLIDCKYGPKIYGEIK